MYSSSSSRVDKRAESACRFWADDNPSIDTVKEYSLVRAKASFPKSANVSKLQQTIFAGYVNLALNLMANLCVPKIGELRLSKQNQIKAIGYIIMSHKENVKYVF